jgi:hypothetical protein
VLDNYVGGGDGVRARFFRDGFEYYSQFSNGTPVPFSAEIPVSDGSVLDFALDPDGAFALNLLDPTTLDDLSDTSDQTIYELEIAGYVAFVPEPSPPLQLIVGALVLSRLRRRRTTVRAVRRG